MGISISRARLRPKASSGRRKRETKLATSVKLLAARPDATRDSAASTVRGTARSMGGTTGCWHPRASRKGVSATLRRLQIVAPATPATRRLPGLRNGPSTQSCINCNVWHGVSGDEVGLAGPRFRDSAMPVCPAYADGHCASAVTTRTWSPMRRVVFVALDPPHRLPITRILRCHGLAWRQGRPD